MLNTAPTSAQAASPTTPREQQDELALNLAQKLATCAPRRGNFLATSDAMSCRRPLRQAALGTAHAVLHRCVDLILYCAVAGPTCRHGGDYTGSHAASPLDATPT